MELPLTLLAASIACSGNSTQLGRWLINAGEIERLGHSGVIAHSKLSEKVVSQFRYALRKPPEQILEGLQAQAWQLCSILDDAYPPLLKTISDPPGLLYVRGDIGLLNSPQIAIVGARGASAEGLGSAFRFAGSLAASGFTITSGLALGIDTHAHRGALSQGRSQRLSCDHTPPQGKTIAVLGNGAGQVYPPRNHELAEQIIAAGSAVVTEFPPGLSPRREHFPARNRIISGLSLATIVVEAAHHSGSLITARLAATQGREVFAMPGSIHNPLSKGCHQLLRDGANWLESLDDLREAFPALLHTAAATDARPENDESINANMKTKSPTQAALMRHFISGLNSIDELALRSGIPIDQLSQQLFDLELSGAVTRLPGGYSRQLA